MSSIKVASIVTKVSITLNYSGETHAVLAGTPEYAKVLQALKDRDFDAIPEIVEKAKQISSYSEGNFTVVDGVLKVNGVEVPARLADKILEFKNEGLPYEGLVAFAQKLLKNPSYRAVQELFTFLETNNHPITDDGNFIAYKFINQDWYDTYTGKTFLNEPGAKIEMPRNMVDENPNQTCSHGLHVANWDYALNHYGAGRGGRMVECSVSPADVVAVPIDYNNAKMRVCAYIVIGEVKSERKELFANLHPAPASNDTDDGVWMRDADKPEALGSKDNYCEECDTELDFDDHEEWCSHWVDEDEDEGEDDVEDTDDSYCDDCDAPLDRRDHYSSCPRTEDEEKHHNED